VRACRSHSEWLDLWDVHTPFASGLQSVRDRVCCVSMYLELWKTLRGLVIICQVPGHAKGVGGISAVAMVDAVAKWAAEGVPREPELLVRRSIATMMGVTDYGRVDRGGQDTLSSLAIGGKVFSEVAKRLQMMWAREMIQSGEATG